MFLVCSQTQLHLFVSFVCFGGPNRSLKIAFHEGRTLEVFNESLPMVWRSLCLPVLPARSCPLKEKVGETPLQWRPLLFLLRKFWELTNTFVLKTFYLLPFFSSLFSTEKDRRNSSIFLSFQFGKVLITLTY